ncbi:ribonuclease H-like domain-containing protein [Tanacetum coccineum]
MQDHKIHPPPPPPPSQTPTQQTPHTVSTIKLPILKKGEYDIWAMKMEHYLAHTDYPIWEVIQNGNGPVSISTDTQGQIKVLPPRTAEEILARERERKARTTLLMALPEDHLAITKKRLMLKSLWDLLKSRFGGNDESKKMQKFSSTLLSQLEIHGAGVSTEDANQKFLRSLPSAWSQVSLIMRTKPGVDSLSFDDLYNNLRVFENDVKGSTASSSSTQNVAFVSENTSSTNDVSTAYGVSNPSGQNSQYEHASSYSLLANQSSCPQLDHEDLEQLDEFDLEEMDLKWQVAMISMRMKKFYKKTGRKLQFDAKEPVGFDKTKVECYSCHKTGHFARECRSKGNQDGRRRDAWNSGNKDKENGRRSGKQEDSKALVTIDGEGVDWTSHSEEEEDYALMACNSSGSDTEVTSCSKECKESYAELKKLYDEQRAQLSDASIEILAYTQALKKVEAQLVAHQQSQLWYEEKIRFMKIDLDDKTDVLTYHKKLLAEAEKEKEDLKAKVEKWHNSSKNLGKLLNTQMSANDKFRLGYGDHRYDGILSYENEVLQSVFMNKERNYMPSGPDIEIDYSQFTYGPKQSQTSESETQTSDFDTCESDCSVETHESLPEPTVNEPKAVNQPKVWSDAPIIEEYESDSEDEHVSLPTEEHETPSFANQQVKTPRETVKNQFTHSKNPKVDKKGLGYGFTTKACFLVLLREKGKLLLSPQQVVIRDPKDITRTKSPTIMVDQDYPHRALQNKRIIDSGCSRHMTRNKAYFAEYQDFNGGPVAFGGSKGYITGKGKIKTGKLDFEDVCFVKELQHFNLFYVLHICDKKNKVLFTDSKCLVLSPEFKLPDENQVLLRIPRQNNMYSFNLENIVPSGGLACLIAKATIDESNKWHRRLGHVNFKNLNKLVKGNLVRGLPSKIFQNYHTCVACQKGKQNKAYYKAKIVSSISQTLQLLHMDLFGPTFVRSLNHKTYCLVITDDFSRSENQANKHAGPQEANHNACTEDNIDVGDSEIEAESAQDYFVLPIWSSYTSTVKSSKANNAGEEPTKHPDLKPVDKEDQVFLDELERLKRQEQDANDAAEALRKEFAQETEDLLLQAGAAKASSTNIVNTASTPVSTASPYGGLSFTDLTNTDQDDSEIPALEEIYDNPTAGIFTNASYDDEGAVADFTNLETVVNVSPIPTSRINSIHPSTLILGDPKSAVQTRSKVTKSSGAHAFVSYIQKQRRNNHKDFQHCLFACFLSQNEPKKISKALEDENFAYGKKAIGNKMGFKNKRMRECCGSKYGMGRIEAIRIFLAFASYMGFIVYQMDVKSSFLYGKIDEEVYVPQPLGFIDPKYPKKVYKVVKALYGLHQAPRAWYATLSTFLLKNGYRRGTIGNTLFIKKDKNNIMLVQVYVNDIIFASTKKSWCDEFEVLMKSRFQMSSMGELTFFLRLQVKQKEDGIFISQDKYVAEILKKFDFTSVKTAITPIETQKPLVKDEKASDVDVHLYRSMIDTLMYLTASTPDIMFAVCVCSRFQVTPKTSHLNAVKRIFRYLKGKPKLGLWYPRVSSFDLEAYSDSDYAGANLDRKSTTGEYVAAANAMGSFVD